MYRVIIEGLEVICGWQDAELYELAGYDVELIEG